MLYLKRSPLKWKFFRIFEYSGQNLSNYLCQFLNDESIPLQILHPSSVLWKITPLYFFSSSSICFAQKKSINIKFFEIFECSSQNLSNSLCQFWNKLIPLQILYPSSVSWKITPLYFFSSKIYTLLKRSPLKWKSLWLLSAQVKICQIS